MGSPSPFRKKTVGLLHAKLQLIVLLEEDLADEEVLGGLQALHEHLPTLLDLGELAGHMGGVAARSIYSGVAVKHDEVDEDHDLGNEVSNSFWRKGEGKPITFIPRDRKIAYETQEHHPKFSELEIPCRGGSTLAAIY